MEPFRYAEDLEREMLEDFGYLNISKETTITKAPNLFGDETLFTEEMNHQPNMTRSCCSENTIQQEEQYTKFKNNQVKSGIYKDNHNKQSGSGSSFSHMIHQQNNQYDKENDQYFRISLRE